MIDNAIKNELKPFLGNNEDILWTGRPAQGILLRSSDIFLIPFSIFWFGFTIFWESTVLISGAPFILKIWGIPFLIIGLYKRGAFFYRFP